MGGVGGGGGGVGGGVGGWVGGGGGGGGVIAQNTVKEDRSLKMLL